ncbi:MAG: ABC transporter permease [Hyphomonas sp. TMED17]|nr:MAG: ABC transporter permease [Hyphomonas sp. TMED17]
MLVQHLTKGLVIASLLTLITACLLGSTPLGPDRVILALFGAGAPGDAVVIWQIRLPRALAAYVVGAALGLSGAALQGLLRNPLAEPGVLGVTASAALGATFVLYYGLVSLSAWVLPIAAISGALLATTIIAIAAIRVQSVITLILIGVGLSSFSAAMMSLLMNLAPNPFALSDILNWMLGSVANRSFNDLYFAAPFLAAGCGILLATRNGLSALTLGEEAASGIGLDLRRQRIFVIIGTGLLTGAAVSIAGAIGFIGIIVPHIVRPLLRHDPAMSLLPSALLAGIALVLADILVRTIPTASELKLGVVMALIGAPLFVWIAMRGQARND